MKDISKSKSDVITDEALDAKAKEEIKLVNLNIYLVIVTQKHA